MPDGGRAEAHEEIDSGVQAVCTPGPMLRRATPWLLLVLLVFAGCSRCGNQPGRVKTLSPARFLPRDAEASLVVPDLGVLGDKIARYEKLKLANFAPSLAERTVCWAHSLFWLSLAILCDNRLSASRYFGSWVGKSSLSACSEKLPVATLF